LTELRFYIPLDKK